MPQNDGTRHHRCSSTYIPSNTETPFRARKGMKMAPPATTTYPRADVSAVTPTPSRNPKRSLVSNDGMSKRELKRSRVRSNSDALAEKDYHSVQPTLPNEPSSYSSFNESATFNASRKEDDSSLGTLAIRFFNLLKTYGEEELDLNDAVLNLGVQKRRIYDVTCVMEGCGMIEKRNKNQVANCCKESESEVFQKKCRQNEIKNLKADEHILDNHIENLQKIIKQYTVSSGSPSMASNLFITKREIASMDNYVNDTVLAIRAPPKTSVYVPHPDQVTKPGMRKFQIEMMCPDKNSVYIHEVKCGNFPTRSLAPKDIPQRQVGRKSHINSGQNMRNHNNMHARELEVPKYAKLEVTKYPKLVLPKYSNSMQLSLGTSNVWAKNRDSNFPLQEQRKVPRNQHGLRAPEISSYSAVPTIGAAIRPKSHLPPPQLPPTDSLHQPVGPSREGVNRSTGTSFPCLKRKHDWSKTSSTKIGLKTTPISIKPERNLDTDSYARRKNNGLKQFLPSEMPNDNKTSTCSLSTNGKVGKYISNNPKIPSLYGPLSPCSATRKQIYSYPTKSMADIITCGPSPNTRNHELLNAPLDSPLQHTPKIFRHSGRSSVDGCAPNMSSPGIALSPFPSGIDYADEETIPNFFSISPMHRAS